MPGTRDPRPPRVGLTLALVALLCLTSGTALADNFGSTARGGTPQQRVVLGNNNVHEIRFTTVAGDPGALDARREEATRFAISNVYNPVRDLTMRTTGGDPDVWVYYDDYGANGVAGWVDCPSSSQTGGPQARGWCRFSQARYNEHYVSGDSQARARSRACHELGHTIGLRHPSDENDPDTFASCMSTPTSASKIGITVHDTNHLNNHY